MRFFSSLLWGTQDEGSRKDQDKVKKIKSKIGRWKGFSIKILVHKCVGFLESKVMVLVYSFIQVNFSVFTWSQESP